MYRESLWQRALAVFFPRRCVLCDSLVEPEELWCGKCPLPLLNREVTPAGQEAWSFKEAWSALRYGASVKHAVITLKKQPDKRAAAFLAEYMASLYQEVYQTAALHCIVEVPSHPDNRKKPGQGHEAMLAKALSQEISLPWLPGTLARQPGGNKQHNLPGNQRKKNAQAAYIFADGADVAGKRVLLIDDIFTSGYTAHACADLLLGAGAQEVCVLTAVAAGPFRIEEAGDD